MAEETNEEAAQRVNSKRNFTINPTMAEKTAEEAAQKAKAKRLAAKQKVRKESAPKNHKNNVKTG